MSVPPTSPPVAHASFPRTSDWWKPRNPLLSRKFPRSPLRPAFLAAASYTSSVIEVRRQNRSAGNQKLRDNVPCTLSRTTLLRLPHLRAALSRRWHRGQNFLLSQSQQSQSHTRREHSSALLRRIRLECRVWMRPFVMRTGGRARDEWLDTEWSTGHAGAKCVSQANPMRDSEHKRQPTAPSS